MDEEGKEKGPRQNEQHIYVLVAGQVWLVPLRKRKKCGTAGEYYQQETGDRWGQRGDQGTHYSAPLGPFRGTKLYPISKEEMSEGF